jgi:hypothetical protein
MEARPFGANDTVHLRFEEHSLIQYHFGGSKMTLMDDTIPHLLGQHCKPTVKLYLSTRGLETVPRIPTCPQPLLFCVRRRLAVIYSQQEQKRPNLCSVAFPAPCPAFLSILISSGRGLCGRVCWSVAACLKECNGTTRSSSASNDDCVSLRVLQQ